MAHRRSRTLTSLAPSALYVALAAFASGTSAGADGAIDFRRDVAPILQQHCIDCHGPNLQMAELRLDQRRFVLGDHADPNLIQSGQGAKSLLIQRLLDRKLGILMPPTFPFLPGEKAGLAEDKISVLKAWIDQGAAWPEGVILATAARDSAGDQAAKAIFAAIRAGDHAAVAALLNADKTIVNHRDRLGSTPLMQAAVYSDARMLTLVLDLGADVNLTNLDGATALMRAAGDFEKVQLLLDRGAKIDAKSAMGRTPLLIAVAYPGNTKTVELLLARGANIADQDSYRETCLTTASKRGDVEMVRLLIKAGADLTAGSRPPLAWAAEEGDVETMACLLAHGADKMKPIVSAALSSSASRGPIEAVQLLLDHGADPNAPSPIAAYTPLMWAAYSENASLPTVQLLLDKGADPKGKGANGETPLSLAKKRGNTAIVELLERAIAGR